MEDALLFFYKHLGKVLDDQPIGSTKSAQRSGSSNTSEASGVGLDLEFVWSRSVQNSDQTTWARISTILQCFSVRFTSQDCNVVLASGSAIF